MSSGRYATKHFRGIYLKIAKKILVLLKELFHVKKGFFVTDPLSYH